MQLITGIREPLLKIIKNDFSKDCNNLCDLSGSGYSSGGRLPQSTVNNQRFSAAEPIDNQVMLLSQKK